MSDIYGPERPQRLDIVIEHSLVANPLLSPIMLSISILRHKSWIISIIHEQVPHIALDESESRSAVRPTAAAPSFETLAELRWCGHRGGTPARSHRSVGRGTVADPCKLVALTCMDVVLIH